jgi:predicted acetyltransferase
MPAPSVVVRLAKPHERPLIEGMAQFYIDDFAAMEPPETPHIVFTQEGGYGPLPDMGTYWSDAPDRHALVIEAYDVPVGFALLNSHSHLTGGFVERNMGEFFVARKYRRHGVATSAVHQLLALYPGQWEAAVVARNPIAQAFWPRAIASAPGVRHLVRSEGDGEHWTGPIWRFMVDPNN